MIAKKKGLEVQVQQQPMTLAKETTMLTPLYRHVLGTKYKKYKKDGLVLVLSDDEKVPLPLSRLGGVDSLRIVLVEQYQEEIYQETDELNEDGSAKLKDIFIFENTVDEAYSENGGGADGRFHTDIVQKADVMPSIGVRQKSLSKVVLWSAFFAAIGDPVDLGEHLSLSCPVCTG